MSEVDLVIVGASPAGLSLAIEAGEAGLEKVVVVDPADSGAPRAVHTGGEVIHRGVDDITAGDDGVTVTLDGEVTTATAVAVVDEEALPVDLPFPVPTSLQSRVHLGEPPEDRWDVDILVVGGSERAALTADRLAGKGAGVVLARGDVKPSSLSRLTWGEILRREAERRLTVLWHSRPVSIDDVGGYAMVTFDDTGTPDLVFDQVVVVGDPDAIDSSSGPVWRVGAGGLLPGRAWESIRAGSFPHLEPDTVPIPAWPDEDARIEELRESHYNATITHFERTHSDLWVVRVRPDRGDVSHQAGQYASLGLGYWEPRADGARDADLERKWENLIRRSYSISSPVFDEHGYLSDPSHSDTLEFYVVLVPAAQDRVPGLTPRLALRRPGDRIYVGPRIVGRYTLAPVTDPETTVVLFATGTGEAPHNAMITELLRKGHHGPIVSVVSVRYRDDLAYLDVHRRLEQRFSNYHYLPLVTRDPDTEKLYVQDVIRRELLKEHFQVDLDPATCHVFLCGNPAMIGLPRWREESPDFPEPEGACQILFERGFDIDRHGHVGNVHTEKYW